jgi:hypothetical protein
MERQKDLNTSPDSILDISLTHRAFLWLQQKTGTTLARKVFKNIGFHSYFIYDNIVDFSKIHDMHAHSAFLFNGHENFTFIATIRNPYETIFSEYNPRRSNKKHFISYIEDRFQRRNLDPFFQSWKRLPDYQIRLENILESYLKIPFVRDSEFAKSGKLLKLIESKPNKRTDNVFWKDYFDKDIADLIYYNTIKYFEMFGYDKNSWMI